MRVLQVMAGAAQGGAETAFEDICLALHEDGIDLRVVMKGNNTGRAARLRAAGINVTLLPFGGAVDVYTSWRLKKIIRDYKPQIVQTWMSRAAMKAPRVPGVVNIARLGGYYNLKYFKTMDYFVANTPDIQSYLLREGVAPGLVAHINNFAPEEKAAQPVSKMELHTPETAKVAVALARYHPVKALDILIRAAAPIDNLHIWLAGQGDEEQNLRQLAADLNVADRIHFLGWRNDRAALLKASDICVVPSRSEPFGNVMVQAWAQRVPLICSNSQGPAQYARPGQDCLMFPIDDVPELEKSLRAVLDDKELATRLTDNGYARYLNEFSKEKTVAAYTDFYRAVLERA